MTTTALVLIIKSLLIIISMGIGLYKFNKKNNLLKDELNSKQDKKIDKLYYLVKRSNKAWIRTNNAMRTYINNNHTTPKVKKICDREFKLAIQELKEK